MKRVPPADPKGPGARLAFFAICAVWLASMAGHYAVMGARVRGDGGRYLSAAASLLAGRELSAKQLLFLPYELFLAGLHWLGGGPVSAVAANCLFTLGAALLLWWMLKRGGEPLAGLVGALALLVTVEIQRWNFYVLVEPFATNLLLAVICLAIIARKSGGWVAYLLPFLCFVLSAARPDTNFFLLPLALYLIFFSGPKGRAAGGLVLAIFLAMLAFSLEGASAFQVKAYWLKGSYIWGRKGIPVPQDADQTMGLIQFALDNFWWSLKLVGYRLYYQLSNIRPYYSLTHNLSNLLLSLAAYGLAIYGSLRKPSWWKESALIWLVFLIQTGMAAVSWADWDGRWLDRVLPPLYILAGIGVVALLGDWRGRRARGADQGSLGASTFTQP